MKSKFTYKKIAPDLEIVKTEVILRICREALKRQAAEKHQEEVYAVSKSGRGLRKDRSPCVGR